MGLTRAAQSPTAIQRSFKVTRLHRQNPTQARTLWWWARKSRRWFGDEQEDIEERLRRHQALMFHRYSKAMKRRSLWDRDEISYQATWRTRGYQLDRDLSSTSSAQAKVEERESKDSSQQDAWREYHSNFESFKRAVDRAIARDPYGTLFGRRLRSPETPNNASWTSWSWIFDPKEIKDSQPENGKGATPSKPKHEDGTPRAVSEKPSNATTSNLIPAQPTLAHSSSSSKTSTTLKSSQAFIFSDGTSTTTEYVYDPISGRKMPRQLNSEVSCPPKSLATPIPREVSTSKRPTDISPKLESKTFLQAMFGENGVSVQVKTYKPPKVYGYPGESKKEVRSSQASSTEEKSRGLSPENSKKREYDQLRMRTLGNNIDATNFNCEPWNNRDPEPPKNEYAEVAPEKRIRSSPAPSEDSPLFSGTTYESKSEKITPKPQSDWLAKEGFRSKQGMTIPSLKDFPTDAAPTQRATKMEPTLDRTSKAGVDIPVKMFGSKLQPSLDRVVLSSTANKRSEDATPIKSSISTSTQPTLQEKREDIDLLRASDVRAAAKAARITRQEVESKKKQERQTLERDFQARQSNSMTFDETEPGAKLDKVWRHIKEYPSGVVARTMQSLGISSSGDSEAKSASGDSTPTISTATIKSEDKSGKQLQLLASELNQIYKESRPEESMQALHATATDGQTIRRTFSEPTVKPGIIRDLEIERHTQLFEPKIAAIIDKAKQVKRELYGVSQGIGDVANSRAITAVADRDQSMLGVKPLTINLETVANAPTPKLVEPSSATQPTNFDTQFILLMYNRELKDVVATPLNNLMGEHVSKTNQNPMAAIGSLHNPSAFVKHFVDLDKNGYELKSGGRDILVFQKKSAIGNRSEDTSIHSTSKLRSEIAAAETSAQPEQQPLRQAANVLNEIPATVPNPGPSAPTAPVIPTKPQRTSSESNTKPSPALSDTPKTPSASAKRSVARVNRQEQVFSGQVRLPPHVTGLPDPEHFQKQNPVSEPLFEEEQHSPDPQLGFFARLRRSIRRIVLTSLAFGVGAYGIGVVAEAINAKAQIASSEAGGPMKKLVLDDSRRKGDRQRAGIFSTESSRE